MAHEVSLVDYLNRAQAISIRAGNLGRAFEAECEQASQGRAIDPDAWNRHKPAFDQYCQALLDLRRDFPRMPERAGDVPQWLVKAAGIGRGIGQIAGTSEPRDAFDDFPSLHSVAQGLSEAVRLARKQLDSVVPLAVLDAPEPPATGEAQPQGDVLCRALADCADRMEGDPVWVLCKSKPNYAKGLNAAVINSLAAQAGLGPVFVLWTDWDGRRWLEVTHPHSGRPVTWQRRDPVLSTEHWTPAKLARTVEYLAAWREARERQLGEPAGAKLPAPSRKRRGGPRPKHDFKADARLAEDWAAAKRTGAYKPDFARERGMSVKDLDRALNRVRKRNRRAD